MKQRRERHFLGRSMSDKTRENFDEDDGRSQEFSLFIDPRRSETHALRGRPSHGTLEQKSEALTRSHTIGYPGEITRDNAASKRVDTLPRPGENIWETANGDLRMTALSRNAMLGEPPKSDYPDPVNPAGVLSRARYGKGKGTE